MFDSDRIGDLIESAFFWGFIIFAIGGGVYFVVSNV